MSDGKTPQEPSMEEILSSIRRIIAADEDQAPQAKAPETIEDDVLELTELVEEPPTSPPAVPTLHALAAPPPPPPPPPARAAEPEPQPMPSEDSLVSPAAAEASASALARLTKVVSTGEERPPEVPGTGRTIEQFVGDLLTPLLKEWLDTNLPAVVERVVEQEVKKLVRRAELM